MHSDLHALTLFTEEVLRIKYNVGELEAGVTGATAAHHVRHRNNFKAGEIHWYEESGETLVAALLRISYSNDVGELRAVSVGNEPFLTN